MMKPAVTVSLVPEARGGPFIFWDDLAGACKKASDLGYAAIEVFPPAPSALNTAELRRLLSEHRLALATLGTGGGWIRQKLTLTSSDQAVREHALSFIKEMIDVAAPFV